MVITQQRLTLEEFLRLPEEEPALELSDVLPDYRLRMQEVFDALRMR